MKKSMGMIFTILGAIGLIYGVISLFTGNFAESYAWIGAVLGLIFFFAGIGLLKNTKEE